jgi:rRNA maturation endonuclease Nob1
MNEEKRFILDSNVLLQHPEILATVGHRRLVIPEAVLKELSSRGREQSRSAFADLVRQASNRGVHIVPSPARLKEELLASDRNVQRLSGADVDIARIAIDYADQSNTTGVVVVTMDRWLREFLSSRGIQSITGAEFLQQASEEKPDPEIQRSAKSFSVGQWKFLVYSALLGFAASLLGNLAFSKFLFLVSTVSVWGTAIVLPLLGILLYGYRQRFRLSYGIFEFLVGVIATYYVFLPTFNYATLTVVQGIQVLSGLYVMVRGLDNVGRGVEGTRAETVWKRIFR